MNDPQYRLSDLLVYVFLINSVLKWLFEISGSLTYGLIGLLVELLIYWVVAETFAMCCLTFPQPVLHQAPLAQLQAISWALRPNMAFCMSYGETLRKSKNIMAKL